MPVLLFSVIAHEYAHGYAALKQGDDTALMLGRLTWNPLKHIDPFMTMLLPLVLFARSALRSSAARSRFRSIRANTESSSRATSSSRSPACSRIC